MTTIIYGLVSVILLLAIGHTRIATNPFSISVEKPLVIVGVILLCIGGSLLLYQAERTGYKKAMKDIQEMLDEKVQETETPTTINL